MPTDLLQTVLSTLSFEGASGYVQPIALPSISRHRHAFAEAFRQFGVVGVFALFAKPNRSESSTEYVPLVYVATAKDAAHAREIHRATWCQGIVPFLIVVTDRDVWSCNGLSFNPTNWEHDTTRVPASAFADGIPEALSHLTARALRTSLVWTDREMGFEGRVDMRLLDNLRALTKILITGKGEAPPLPIHLANALVGRFLYVRFLKDRMVFPPGWLSLLQEAPPNSNDILERMWASFDKVERIFNGSIFLISTRDREKVTTAHASWLFAVLLQDADMLSSGLQTSFRDFIFSSVRTETLSAVYELFLENGNPVGGVEDGAVYTPPFLVDFVLSQVEQTGKALGAEDRVLDCAAGSGVFLVGAFRRIIESTLVGHEGQTLPLKLLQQLLRKCIWGAERNGDACHVAAFSLYLTMLDYLDRGEIAEILASNGRRKMFPTLVGRNIWARDFLRNGRLGSTSPKTFSVAVANPPWQKVTENGPAALAYLKGPRSGSIDRGRVASCFFWKTLDSHLAKDGRFGFVMSGRALISSGAERFPKALISEVGVTRLINLSHMRRKLFPRAEHPAVVIVGWKDRTNTGDRIRVSSPMLSSQPVARDGTPWAIIEDRCEIEVFRRDRLQSSHALIEALTLRPLDRQLSRWLCDRAAAKKIPTLNDVLERHSLSIKRGGYLPETGVSPQYTLGGNATKANYYRSVLNLDNVELDLIHERAPYPYSLPSGGRTKIVKEYAAPFGGNVVAVPRSMSHVDFIATPFAFNSSINAIYSTDGRTSAVPILQAIAKYLNTDFAEYCFALFGRDWSMDERRLEQKELRQIPMPPALMDEHLVADFSTKLLAHGEEAIYDELALSRSFRLAAKEFMNFRRAFQNGRVPANAHAVPDNNDLAVYAGVLDGEMTNYVGKGRSFKTDIKRIDGRSIAVVTMAYSRGVTDTSSSPSSEAIVAAFDMASANVFQESAWVYHDAAAARFAMVKPLSKIHWTVERAFADADRLMLETAAASRRVQA